jgi:hypothetical protein
MELFWRSQFAGWQPPKEHRLPLPVADSGVNNTGQRFAQLFGSPCVSQADLIRLGQQHNTTLAAVLHLAWALLLASVTSSSDLVFGVVLSGRDVPVPCIDSMVGLLICTLPLRLQFDESTTFGELLQRTHQALWAITKNQHCNFVEICEWSGLRGSSGAMFHTLLNLESFPESDSSVNHSVQAAHLNIDGLQVTGAELPLAMIVGMRGESLNLTLRYDTTLYTSDSMSELMKQFTSLLNIITAIPEDLSCTVLAKSAGLFCDLPTFADVSLLKWHQQYLPYLQSSSRLTLSSLPLVDSRSAAEPRSKSFSLTGKLPSEYVEDLDNRSSFLAIGALAVSMLLCRLSSTTSALVLVSRDPEKPPVSMQIEQQQEAQLRDMFEACLTKITAIPTNEESVSLGSWLNALTRIVPEDHLWILVGDAASSKEGEQLNPHIHVLLNDEGNEFLLKSVLNPSTTCILHSCFGKFLENIARAILGASNGGISMKTMADVPLLSPGDRKMLVEDSTTPTTISKRTHLCFTSFSKSGWHMFLLIMSL